MSLIEQLGGYEKAKAFLNATSFTIDELIMMQRSGLRTQHVEKALLEYRRQHNIFEVGDKVVYRKQCNLIWDGVYDVDAVLADGQVIERDLPTPKEWLSHATDEEIQAGHRLDLEVLHDHDIPPSTIMVNK